MDARKSKGTKMVVIEKVKRLKQAKRDGESLYELGHGELMWLVRPVTGARLVATPQDFLDAQALKEFEGLPNNISLVAPKREG